MLRTEARAVLILRLKWNATIFISKCLTSNKEMFCMLQVEVCQSYQIKQNRWKDLAGRTQILTSPAKCWAGTQWVLWLGTATLLLSDAVLTSELVSYWCMCWCKTMKIRLWAEWIDSNSILNASKVFLTPVKRLTFLRGSVKSLIACYARRSGGSVTALLQTSAKQWQGSALPYWFSASWQNYCCNKNPAKCDVCAFVLWLWFLWLSNQSGNLQCVWT